ncbi:aldehyde dehydrogenase [Anaerobacillus sp. 1_MG-2023]|uniref:aldehyde dehydrogenase n=1 Tax=Anaerobacillus sp. 1_MG-2023 TaxID=3062655 RepID=UPI0026E12B1A|nr:aldehyde dehydrogenase [Anaerobacillus sp. 1_MG-2023]MDO6655862.1 aldehyde dehydrogenase [Anaerobacillus sp. 1_MG-2023]
MKSYQLYINGEFTNSHSEEMLEVINPATEEVISRIPKSDENDVQRAIEAAKASQREWEKKPSIERAEYLYKIADKVEEKKEAFINMLTEENGKTVDASKAEVDLTIDYFRYMAGWARRYEGEVLPSDRPNENILVFKKPIGIVGGIVPWNFPMFIFARKVAPAFVTGCPIIIKPSQYTPNTACELASIIHEIGVPKGVFSLVTGKGSDIGTPLASSPDVQMISLTGSYPAGSKVMEAAAKNITKVNLELGGKAPAIVTKHANVDLAVEKITTSRITNNGQACTNAERVYVHEDVAEEFISKITNTFKNTKVGDSLNEDGCDIGPLANKQQIDSVEEMVNNAVKAGAVVKTGGKRVDRDKGFFFEPTVLTDVSQDMNVIQEEIFGPVLPIVVYSDFDKVLEMANDTHYGLSSSIFSDNIHEVMKASNVLRYGETYVNRENFEAVQGFHAGMGQSGIGGADGKHGLNEYLKTHVIYMEYDQDIK